MKSNEPLPLNVTIHLQCDAWYVYVQADYVTGVFYSGSDLVAAANRRLWKINNRTSLTPGLQKLLKY